IIHHVSTDLRLHASRGVYCRKRERRLPDQCPICDQAHPGQVQDAVSRLRRDSDVHVVRILLGEEAEAGVLTFHALSTLASVATLRSEMVVHLCRWILNPALEGAQVHVTSDMG